MSRYDGLIIPRSYSEYINKTDAATLLQALQLSGVMDAAPTAGSNHPVKSSGLVPVDEVTSGNNKAVTSNAVNRAIESITKNTIDKHLDQAGWYKICTSAYYSYGFALKIFLTSVYNSIPCGAHSIDVAYGWTNPKISETCSDNYTIFDKLMITYETDNLCNIFVHYNRNDSNVCGVKIIASSWNDMQIFDFLPADITGLTAYKIINLGTDGFYVDGTKVA